MTDEVDELTWDEGVERAAQEVFDAVRHRDSALAPGNAAWTHDHAVELIEGFVDRPDETGASFDEKLQQQLSGVSQGAICLMAELFYLNVLPLADYASTTKHDLVLSVLRRAGVGTIPDSLDVALTGRVFNGGVAFKTRRYWQLTLLCRFAEKVTSIDEERLANVLADPWAFRDFLNEIGTPKEPAQRHSLLYLAFPGTFLPIVSERHRIMIRDAFADAIGGASSDVDRDLLSIHSTLRADYGADFDFYRSPWVERWKRPAKPEELEEGMTRGWLVRGSSVNGRDLVPTWLSKGSVSLAATRLRDVEPGMTKDELKPIVETDYAHTSYSSRAEKLDEFHFFLSRMQIGDLVATTDQGRLYVGRVTGEATYQASDDGRSNLRRQAVWSQRGVDYADLPPELAARLQSQRDVLDLTQQLDALEQLLEAGPQAAEEKAPAPLHLADATAELAEELLVPQAWLQSCIDLLNDRPQLIFYGPPGTGKTYLARRLAAFLADDNVKLVQFHPAYSYEDFFEGYRPTPQGTFELRPGPLRRLVDQAQDDPSTPYMLIIDEINRGNLAKIFGELYFLLEYRDQTIDLLYAAGDDTPGFTLPKNVYLIGTMNTADRSIALVDAAMRRRFSFMALRPDEEPTKGLLRRWLKRHHHDGFAADLLDEVNARIDDRDFQVGPSYLMRPAVYADGGLERVWRSDILPLLEEHHYGDGVDVSQRYGLAAVSAAVARDSPAERPEGE